MNWTRALRNGVMVALAIVVGGCGGGGGGSEPPTPPSISQQPQAVTVNDGASASFSVTASGTRPLTYQWKKNDANIDGAVGAVYTIGAAPFSDNGSKFSVVVTNSVGAATSQTAALTVTALPPTISMQPQAISANDGSTATFSVVGAGTNPQYQWLKNGVAIDGATSSSYTTADLTMADDKSQYSVVISNLLDSITSASAPVTVRPQPPSFPGSIQSLTVKDGSPVNFIGAAKGTAPMTFQWLRNGSPIAGATGPNYSFNSLFADNGVRFSVTATNAYGSATSTVATLTVDPSAPGFSIQPSDLSAYTGSPITLQASANGTAPLSYQWQRSDDGGFEWTNIVGATSPTFSISSLTLAWANVSFRVVVSNLVATVASRSAALTVVPRVHVVVGAVGGSGFADGQGAAARFNSPFSFVSDASGNIYVADMGNRAIRRITPQNLVSTVADTGTVFFPFALAIDASGNLYAGSYNRIIKIATDGSIVTLAGQDYASGSTDGVGAAARFSEIYSMAFDASGNLLVVDRSNRIIRRVTMAGVVTTIAGVAGQFGYVDGKGSAARFGDMRRITSDAAGNAYVIDGSAIRKITPDGTVTRFAGRYQENGTADGDVLSTTRFNTPLGLSFDSVGNLYVAEFNAIRRISTSGISVTIAGSGGYDLNRSPVDGTGSNAYLKEVGAIAALPTPNTLIFADGPTIRTITASGKVTTVAGMATPNGNWDGIGSGARLNSPRYLVSSPSGSLYHIDQVTGVVRKTSSMGVVSTPSSYRFSSACGIAVDAAESVYVAGNSAVYKMTRSGTVSLVSGNPGVSASSVDGPASTAKFNYPCGIAVDATGNIWVAELLEHTIRKISSNGVVSTVAGVRGTCGNVNGRSGVALLCSPTALTMDPSGSLIVLEQVGDIRRMAPDGTVAAVAGIAFSSGSNDGPVARFSNPSAVAADKNGNLYVADTNNHLIRKVAPNGVTSTVMGVRGAGSVLTPGDGGSIGVPAGVAVTPDDRVFLLSEQALVGD